MTCPCGGKFTCDSSDIIALRGEADRWMDKHDKCISALTQNWIDHPVLFRGERNG